MGEERSCSTLDEERNSSTPQPQPLGQPAIEDVEPADLSHGCADVILDPLKVNGASVIEGVAGPPIPVARLADRTDVHHRLVPPQMRRSRLGSPAELRRLTWALEKDTGNVRVALKA